MGAALARGAQRHVLACVKHYACNSMENARFWVDVRVDERVLHEIYLPHFRAVVEAGVASVMSAYNSVNGEWCGQNRVLLTDILRDEWGFAGFVVSDFIWGLRDPVASLAAGLDVEMPFAQQRARALPAALGSDAASWSDVDRSVLRILATQLRFAARLPDDPPPPEVVLSEEHRALAREVAARSMVLLRNEPVDGRPVLPLAAGSLHRLAVLGRLADVPNTGDHGSSNVRTPHVVTPLAGLRAALPGTEIGFADGNDPDAAASAAAAADAAVVVVGYTAEDEGEYVGSFEEDLAALYPPADDPQALAELARAWGAGPQAVGGDRDSLRLHAADEALIRAVAAANPRTVVVVMAGAAVTMEDWRQDVPAVLFAFYPGMEGGAALADVLLGVEEPGGRLPFVIPRSEQDLPPFDKEATTTTYDRWHGQRLLDRNGVPAAYPLGFGLSYSTYAISAVQARVEPESLAVSATVANTGGRPGGHVLQVYASRTGSQAAAERALVGFSRARLAAGEQARVELGIPLLRLASRRGPGNWAVEPGTYRIEVASHAADRDAAAILVTVS
jgi:beta-glucosidase